ncbi:MAG: glycerol-3-phosphate 1-O-acyltransferase PlsY [Gemmataceae bacterium]
MKGDLSHPANRRSFAPAGSGRFASWGVTLAVLDLLAVTVASYLVGAIPFGYLIARARGVDILAHGSGNIGATNVGRVLGRRWGVLVFLFDFAKGAAPVAIARWLLTQPDELPPDSLAVVAGISAFLGHLFPVYLRFRGGKGVATGAGVIAVLVPVLTAIVLVVWAAVLLTTRTMSLASLTAAALLLILRLATQEKPWHYEHVVVTSFCLVACLLVFVRHQGNIRRLFAGTEHRL